MLLCRFTVRATKQHFLSTLSSVLECTWGTILTVIYLFIFNNILTLSLPECLMEFCKATLTFESMDEIL